MARLFPTRSNVRRALYTHTHTLRCTFFRKLCLDCTKRLRWEERFILAGEHVMVTKFAALDVKVALK